MWRRKPDPPVNARIRFSDGAEVPVDLVYKGRGKCGHGSRHHQWGPAWPAAFDLRSRTPVAFLVDHLPAKTCITFALQMQDDG